MLDLLPWILTLGGKTAIPANFLVVILYGFRFGHKQKVDLDCFRRCLRCRRPG
jgi:hypothetical protein